MKKFDKKDRLKGLLGSVLFHGVFLTVFLLFGFSNHSSLSPKNSIEIRLGDLEGMGFIDNSNPPAVSPSKNLKPLNIDDKSITQNIEITNPVKGKEKQRNDPLKANIDNKDIKSDPLVNNDMLYRAGDKNGHYQGNGHKPGYQGDPNGNPNSKSPTGIVDNNISVVLGGRISKYLPIPQKTFSTEGTVVVAITVDRNGKVIIATPGAKGSTTTDATLKKLATDAAYKATFDVKSDASEEQKGTITYHFRLN